jgi:hypothetical protein
MTTAANPSSSKPASYHGEVWTDARGFATVRVPSEAGALEPPFQYELRDVDPQSTARVTAELDHGRFTIATEQPHVKVAWQITGRRSDGQHR